MPRGFLCINANLVTTGIYRQVKILKAYGFTVLESGTSGIVMPEVVFGKLSICPDSVGAWGSKSKFVVVSVSLTISFAESAWPKRPVLEIGTREMTDVASRSVMVKELSVVKPSAMSFSRTRTAAVPSSRRNEMEAE